MNLEVIVVQVVATIVAGLFFTWVLEKDKDTKHAGLESNLLMGFLVGMFWIVTVPAFVVLVVAFKLIKAIR